MTNALRNPNFHGFPRVEPNRREPGYSIWWASDVESHESYESRAEAQRVIDQWVSDEFDNGCQ